MPNRKKSAQSGKSNNRKRKAPPARINKQLTVLYMIAHTEAFLGSPSGDIARQATFLGLTESSGQRQWVTARSGKHRRQWHSKHCARAARWYVLMACAKFRSQHCLLVGICRQSTTMNMPTFCHVVDCYVEGVVYVVSLFQSHLKRSIWSFVCCEYLVANILCRLARGWDFFAIDVSL